MPVNPSNVLASLIAVLGLAGAAWGQPPNATAVDDSLLASLVQEALARNPSVLSAQEALQAARSRPAQVEALPNPMLSVQYTNDGIAPSLGERDMTTLAFMLSQDLPYPGKRGLRGEILQRDADLASQQLERVKLGVTASVRRAYSGLVLARDQLRLVGDQSVLWKQIEGIARSRYTVGQAGQQDVLRVQVEVTRIAQLQAEQEVQGQIRLAELNQLLARGPDSPLETRRPPALRHLDQGYPEWFDKLRSVSPEVRNASLAVERERLAVRLASKEYRPDLTLQAGYMNRGGLDPMWLAGVELSLPVYRSRPAGAVAEAEARLRAGERSAESVQSILRLRTQERVAQIQTTERIAELYSQSIIPQDSLSVDAAISNYQVGRIPFITVLEALSTLYSDRSTYVGLLANHQSLLASLEEASLEASPGMVGVPAATAARQAAIGQGGLSTTETGAGEMR